MFAAPSEPPGISQGNSRNIFTGFFGEGLLGAVRTQAESQSCVTRRVTLPWFASDGKNSGPPVPDPLVSWVDFSRDWNG